MDSKYNLTLLWEIMTERNFTSSLSRCNGKFNCFIIGSMKRIDLVLLHKCQGLLRIFKCVMVDIGGLVYTKTSSGTKNLAKLSTQTSFINFLSRCKIHYRTKKCVRHYYSSRTKFRRTSKESFVTFFCPRRKILSDEIFVLI